MYLDTRLRHLYRIEFFSRTVPQCFRKWAILDFTNTERVIWVWTRKRRDELLCCDRSARSSSHIYRQCRRCGRKYLGFDAIMLKDDQDRARRMGLPDPPCCRGCE